MPEDNEITLTVELDTAIPGETARLWLMEELFGNALSVTNDYEFAIGVLLEYATADHLEDDDAADAIEEISDVIAD